MPQKLIFRLLLVFYFTLSFSACKENSPPVIESFISESDEVKTGSSNIFEVIITDADNDVTNCYWFFDAKRKPEFDRQTKVTWVAPSTPGDVLITIVVDDGKTETCLNKTIIVY